MLCARAAPGEAITAAADPGCHTAAVALTPENKPEELTQAVALQLKGHTRQAQRIYDEILLREPRNFAALHLSGVIAIQTGDPQRAVDLIGRALAVDSRNAEAHCNRGAALGGLGRWDEALSSYARAIEINPGYAEAHLNRGNALHAMGHSEAALASFDQSIAIKPGFAQAHCNRGDLLHELRRLDQARLSYAHAIAAEPGHADALLGCGNVLKEMQQWDAAMACYDRAIAARPGFAEAHSNRGLLLHELGRYEAAIVSYALAIAAKPGFAAAHSHRGNALLQLNRVGEAIASYDRAIAISSGYAEVYFNRSVAWLLAGDFARGWPDYEWRWLNENGPNIKERRHFPQPLWLGQAPIAGKTILLHSEQGLGDTLQFCRYAKAVAALGARVILEVPEPLIELLGTLDGVTQLVPKGMPLPDFDCHCPLLSLPLAFKTRLDTIPCAGPYLRADAAKVAFWQRTLGDQTRPRIGLVWRGNPNHANDRNRGIRLAGLTPHLPDGLQYVSLQKNLQEADRRTLAANPQILDLTGELRDFSDTAALCECLDLVISVDTSVAHLSAALGRKTWVLLPFSPDWRWLLDRDDSPWYDSVSLYRSTRTGDWTHVTARIAADLAAMFPAAVSANV